jgi:integrase
MHVVDFREHLLRQGLSDRSADEYVKYARRLLAWAGAEDPAAVTVTQIRGWSTATVPDSWASRKQARSAVRHLMVWAGRDDGAWNTIQVPAKPDAECRALGVDDARTLRDVALLVGGRRGAAVLLVLYTGARRVEVARMRWDHIDLHAGTICWPRAKRGRSFTVDLHPVLAGELGRLGRHGEYLFGGNNGRPHVAPATVWSWCRQVGDLAGVHFPTHVGRHTALATALDATGDLRAVQDLAGHRDPAQTARYTRTTRERMGRVVRSLDY